MKIALFTDGIHPYVIGGMQKHSFYLAKYFAIQEVYIDLYLTNKSSYDINKLEFFTESEKKYITHFVIDFPHGDKFPGHYIRASYKYSENIFEIFKKNSTNIDFIYAKGFTAWKLMEEKQKGFRCPPIGVNFHGYEMFQKAPDVKSWLQQKFILKSPAMYNINQADYLFSYGGKITQIIKTLITDHSKIIEIPTGIEPKWLKEGNISLHNPIKFVFVGRYERRKGIEELNEVLKELIQKYPFEFNFVGPIPLNEQIRSEQVNYFGSISDSEKIKELLLQNDVLVCPSHSEGMPNVIVEAMACGLVIIASDVGAVNQLVSYNNGILIKPGDASDLKTAILKILQTEKLRFLVLKQNSITNVKQHFLWDDIIVKTIEKIRKLA